MEIEELQGKLLEAAQENNIEEIDRLLALSVEYDIEDLLSYAIMDDEITSETLEHILEVLGDSKPDENAILGILKSDVLEDLIKEGLFTDQYKFNVLFNQYRSRKIKEAVKNIMAKFSK
jgi:hypothetical protein